MGYTNMKRIILEFTDDDLDGGRIAMNSIDAFDALQFYVDELWERAQMTPDEGEKHAMTVIYRQLKEKLQDWSDM
jgi:hypothetical protein|tara:strand:- start:484 stop:708 length:225 start_codon:yes stop_codon:yes gene_type:complete